MATPFSKMTDSQINELFTLAPSTWKENSPIWHHDYQRTADKTRIAKNLIMYVWAGDCDNTEQAKAILDTMDSHEDRIAFARMMVDADNYIEFAPDYKNLGQDEALEKKLHEAMDKYDGLDAYVEAAQLELAWNIAEDYADVEDLIELFAPRFILQPSQEPGFWVATDTINGIVVKFKHQQFNDTQQVTLLNGDTFKTEAEAVKVATYLRELSDWLRDNHYNKVLPDPINIRKYIGNRICKLRTEQGLSVRALAALAGVTPANITNIENGKYSVGLDILNKIAIALGVKIELN